jgi:hypothetical protein
MEATLNTGQIGQVIEKNILPTAAVDLRLNPNHEYNSSPFNLPAIAGILCEY